MSKRVHKPTQRMATLRVLASTMLLLSWLPLWGDGPQIHVDEAQSAFRVSGAAAREVLPNPLVLGGHVDDVAEVSLSADGRLALSGDNDGVLRLWDVRTGELLHAMRGHRHGVWAVALSRDGSLALSGGADNTVRVWDVRTGELLHTMKGHEHQVTSVALSADGSLALSGSRDETLRLWYARTGEHLRTMTGHWGWVQAVALSADGGLALSGSPDKTVRVWDAQTGKLLRIMEGHEDEVFGVSLSADGHLALSGGFDGTVRLWDARTGKLLHTMTGHEGRVFGVSLSADGRLALSGGDDEAVRAWNAQTGELLHTMTGHRGLVEGVALSADGRLALSGGWDQTVLLWRLSWFDFPSAPSTPPGTEATVKGSLTGNWRQPPLVLRGHEKGVADVALSADGRFALSGSYDYTVRFWDVTTGKLVHTLTGHQSWIDDVSLSADGRIALSGSGWDSSVYLWDTTTGRPLHTITSSGLVWGAAGGVSLSADGSLGLSGARRDGNMRLWDVGTGKLLRVIKVRGGGVRDVSLSADGRLALSGSYDHNVRLWDVTAGTLLHTMRGHGDDILSVSLSADGRLALSGGGDDGYSSDTDIRLWDATTGELLLTMEDHVDTVRSVSLNVDGRLALSGSDDYTVRLWDTTTGELLHTMRDHNGEVHGVALSPDGRLALSGGSDHTVIVRSLPVFNPQRSLRQVAERYAMQAMAERIGPAIPTPTLPPLLPSSLPPVREHQQGPSETEAMFEQRMTRARAERAWQIGDIRARYHAAVQKRNAKIASLEKNQLQRIHLGAHARAVAEVFGHPVLVPRHDEHGNPWHQPEAVSPRLHLTVQFEHVEHSEDWHFDVPPGEPARGLQAALEAGTALATTEYRLKDGVLSLVAVHAHHGDRQYTGAPAPAGSSAPSPTAWAIDGDMKLLTIARQNPNPKDAALERYEAQQHSAYDDDIPSLFKQAEAAETDSRKWLFVVGVEHYEQTDNISHARRSAHWFAKALAKTLGVAYDRRIILLDDATTGSAIKRDLARLRDGVREGDHVYLYYAGHGLPAPTQDNAPLILPRDAVPNFAHEDDAFRVENILRTLTRSNAAQVTAFMDTCFTGMTERGSVFKNEADTQPSPKQLKPPENGKLAMLTACDAGQHPNVYGEKGHRLFSYFLIRELLKGEHTTIGDLYEQVAAHVTSAATDPDINKRQNPVLRGNRSLELLPLSVVQQRQTEAANAAKLRERAEQGDAQAQYGVGVMYQYGRGVPRDDEQAAHWYHLAAQQGHVSSQYALGEMYEDGDGVPRDDEQAAHWYRLAAQQGDVSSQYKLGWMYEDGDGVREDGEQAAHWYRLAAQQGHINAQFNLGWAYRMGPKCSGIARNDVEAAHWFRLAAEQGHTAAQEHLGAMYRGGLGVTRDDAEAVRWYRMAAEGGDEDAQHSLGSMYRDGLGVAQDYAEAMRWYRMSAEGHNEQSAYELGDMYSQGLGVPKDAEKARYWYRRYYYVRRPSYDLEAAELNERAARGDAPAEHQSGSEHETTTPAEWGDDAPPLPRVIYFELDRAEIIKSARSILDLHAKYLLGSSERRVTVEGHADRRSYCYPNLYRGEYRADAVRRYLMDAGVPGSQIAIVSHGEGQPAELGYDESSSAKNRRAVLVYEEDHKPEHDDDG